MGYLWSQCVRDRGADRAAPVVRRSEHEVIDQQLRSAAEQIGKGLRSTLRLEAVVLLNRNPGQLSPLSSKLVAPTGELLLLLQQLVAFAPPLLERADPVQRHLVPPVSGSAGF